MSFIPKKNGAFRLTLLTLLCLCGLVACLTLTTAQSSTGSSNSTVSSSTAGVNTTNNSSSSTGTSGDVVTTTDQTDDQKEVAEAAKVAEHPFLEFNGLVNLSWFKFFVIAVASSRLAFIFPKLGLPLITGYMIIGCLCGPYVLGLVTKPQIPDLSYVTQTALAFIAFSAGSELYLPELRSLLRTIALITGFNAIFSYIFCTIFIYLIALGGVVPWMTPYIGSCAFSISMVAGSIMVARSPASAIAVVRELKAKGPCTSIMLGVTVVGDVVVLVLFTLSNSFALALCGGGGFDGGAFLVTLLTLCCAVGLGYGLGFFLIFLLWIPKVPAKFTIIPLGFLIFVLCDWIVVWTEHHWGFGLNFDALLICITAGYVVTNKSQNRVAFLKMLGGAGLYIFIPFFTLVGVQLNLQILVQSIGFGVLVFLMRAICIAAGSYTGGTLAGLDKDKRLRLWMTMLAQAGVSLGLAAEVAVKFPEWGSKFQTTIISVVLINQFVGPVACKYALKQFGEAGKMLDGEEDEHGEHSTAPKKLKRVVIVGVDSQALAVAAKLLKAGFRVTLMDTKKVNLILAKSLGIAKKNTNSTIDDANTSSSASSSSSETAGLVETPDSSSIDMTPEKEPVLDLILVPATTAATSPSQAYGGVLEECHLEAAIIGLENDQQSYELGTYINRIRHCNRVLVRIHNPAWTDAYKQAGLLPVSSFGITTQTMVASVQSRGNLQVVSATLSLQDALNSMISPVEDLQHIQLPMSGRERVEWDEAHPAPSQENVAEILKHLNAVGVESESVKLLSTVSVGQRKEYIDDLHQLHDITYDHSLSSQQQEDNQEMFLGIAGHQHRDDEKSAALEREKQEQEEFERQQVEQALAANKQ